MQRLASERRHKWEEYDKVLLGAGEKLTMLEILRIMRDSIQSSSKIAIADKSGKQDCALISIQKAVDMGYKPMNPQKILSDFY